MCSINFRQSLESPWMKYTDNVQHHDWPIGSSQIPKRNDDVKYNECFINGRKMLTTADFNQYLVIGDDKISTASSTVVQGVCVCFCTLIPTQMPNITPRDREIDITDTLRLYMNLNFLFIKLWRLFGAPQYGSSDMNDPTIHCFPPIPLDLTYPFYSAMLWSLVKWSYQKYHQTTTLVFHCLSGRSLSYFIPHFNWQL